MANNPNNPIEKSNWVTSQAARKLGTTRRILKYRMDQLGIKKEGIKQEENPTEK